MIIPSSSIGTVNSLRNYSTQDLVCNVDFSNDYGFAGSTAYDLSSKKNQFSTPSGYVSVISGSTAAPGYIDLDGTSNYLLSNNAISELASSNAITIDAWFKVDTVSAAARTLVANNTTTTTNPGFGIAPVQSTPGVYYCRGSMVSSLTTLLLLNPTTVTANTGEWVNGFFNFEYNAAIGSTYTASFYKTGGSVLTQSVFASGVPFISTTPIHIGRRATAIQYFDGQIGSIKIYNRILSSDENSFNYNHSKTRYGHT